MDKVFVALGLKFMAGKVDGKKAYFAAAALMLVGLTKIIMAAVAMIVLMFPDLQAQTGGAPVDIDGAKALWDSGCLFLGNGLLGLGLRHGIAKVGTSNN